MSAIDMVRELAGMSSITTARVFMDRERGARSDTARFGYSIDLANVVRDYDSQVARAERAEAENAELRAVISKLLEKLA